MIRICRSGFRYQLRCLSPRCGWLVNKGRHVGVPVGLFLVALGFGSSASFSSSVLLRFFDRWVGLIVFVPVGFCGPDCVLLVTVIFGVSGMNAAVQGLLWWFSIVGSVFSSGWLRERGVVFSVVDSSVFSCVGLPVGVQVSLGVLSVSGGSVMGVVSAPVVFFCVVRGFPCGFVGFSFCRVMSWIGKDGSMMFVKVTRVASSVSSFKWGVSCLALLVATRSALSQSTTISDFIVVMVSSCTRR